MKEEDRRVGMYPKGFRHYENYLAYHSKFPDRTIEDYSYDMNRDATLSDFVDVNKAKLLEVYQDEPMRYYIDDLTNGDSGLFDKFLDSETFHNECGAMFVKR